MKKLILLTVILLGFCGAVVFGEDTPRARIETMFTSLQPGNLDRVIELFAKDSLMRPELVDQLKTQTHAVLTAEKKILGFEFIEELNLGQSIKRLTYVLKIADQPMVWRFSFYKPGATWLPQKVIVSDE